MECIRYLLNDYDYNPGKLTQPCYVPILGQGFIDAEILRLLRVQSLILGQIIYELRVSIG